MVLLPCKTQLKWKLMKVLGYFFGIIHPCHRKLLWNVVLGILESSVCLPYIHSRETGILSGMNSLMVSVLEHDIIATKLLKSC